MCIQFWNVLICKICDVSVTDDNYCAKPNLKIAASSSFHQNISRLRTITRFIRFQSSVSQKIPQFREINVLWIDVCGGLRPMKKIIKRVTWWPIPRSFGKYLENQFAKHMLPDQKIGFEMISKGGKLNILIFVRKICSKPRFIFDEYNLFHIRYFVIRMFNLWTIYTHCYWTCIS